MSLNSIFAPLGRHWRGEYSLTATLTCGLLIPSALLILTTKALSASKLESGQQLIHIAGGITGLISYFVVCACALVSINRKSRLSAIEYGVGTTIAACNALAVVASVYTLLQIIDLITGVPKSPGIHAELYQPLEYRLQNNDRSTLIASGEIGNTSTLELQKIISENNEISTLVLNSKGGNVFEARGIARLIREHQLDTYVTEFCYSACTLAFVSGLNRTATVNAIFGFHAYKLDALGNNYQIDVKSEQAKDALMYIKNGVDQSFVDRIFSTAHTDIWKPDREVLLDSGFLTHN